jgi:hypothetical protein
MAGCATPRNEQIHMPLAQMPEEGLMTHRAILSARGKGEFALTGYLAVSRSRGMRLIISQNFGGQLADVLIKPDGSVHVMKAGPMLKPEWIRKYVAADLKCIFGKPDRHCQVRVLGPDHFEIKHFIYRLDLRIVSTTPGQQPTSVFELNPTAGK